MLSVASCTLVLLIVLSWPEADGAPTTGDLDWADRFIIEGKPRLEQRKAAFVVLPPELIPVVLRHLEPQSIFRLALSCRQVYGLVLDHGILTSAIRLFIKETDGSLHWVLPVSSLQEENNHALRAMRSWMLLQTPEADNMISGRGSQKPVSLVLNPAFRLLAFVRACFLSDTMQSRRRRWSIIKQFDLLWTDYRHDGWERDDFAPVGTTWAQDSSGELRCQCSLV